MFSFDVLRQNSPRSGHLTLLHQSPSHPAPNKEIIEGLYSIRKTPYECSFASRLMGCPIGYDGQSYLIHRDWETQAPWMDLLADIGLHYSLSQ